MNPNATPGREENGGAIAGALAIVAIYFIPALSSAPQLVQGAVQLIVTYAVCYAVGFLPKPKA